MILASFNLSMREVTVFADVTHIHLFVDSDNRNHKVPHKHNGSGQQLTKWDLG